MKEEYIETDFQKVWGKEGDQIFAKPFDTEPEEDSVTTCEHCERNFDDMSGYEEKNHHRGEKNIQCPHCEETFSKQASLSRSGKSSR